MELCDLRASIDAADDEIVRLFDKRMRLVRAVAYIKRAQDLPTYSALREREIVERAVKNSALPKEYTEELFSALFKLSKAYQAALNERNIVLIGMPGCGKSAIGRALADALHMEFFDTDAAVARKTERTPAQIIRECGEDAFRDIECEAVREACGMTDCVIATGGGTCLRDENRRLLKQNATVVYIRRDTCALSVEDRPLSTDLAALYSARHPIYIAMSDLQIDARDQPQMTAKAIIEAIAVC